MSCEKERVKVFPDLNSIPVLKYLKEPVMKINDLYVKYPLGGEYGWYAWVHDMKTFAYWDINKKEWLYISSRDLQTVLGIKTDTLKEGDIPVWDAENKKFVIINMSVIGTEEW